MPKKKPPESSLPSKAYLVSFGDTMTALLAFFIVLNSLAKEQTGANMYSGTGSFVNAFSSSGLPGGLPNNRSSEMIQQEAPMPIYALADNLDKNKGTVGPDDTTKKENVADRDTEQFQKFLTISWSNFVSQLLPKNSMFFRPPQSVFRPSFKTQCPFTSALYPRPSIIVLAIISHRISEVPPPICPKRESLHILAKG